MTPLSTEDFTEEQLAAIQAEIDRERTNASKTARKNAIKEAEADLQTRIQEALEVERAKLEADEQGKLEIQRKEIEKAQAELAAERKTLKATKKLISAGFGEDEVETLIPMFVAVDDKAFDTTMDSIIKVSEARVKSHVDTVKQELLESATPPATSTGTAPVDSVTEAMKLAENANDIVSQAQAAELLLQGAMNE